MRIRNLGIAAAATLFAVGSTGGPALAAPAGGSGNSSATITLERCVLESTKEISNIEYFSDGASVAKDETMSTLSYDLAIVTGIEDIDTVSVKAGTTVETFDVECPVAPEPAPDDGNGDEDGAGDDDSSAAITLSECVLSSTKEISNIEYYSGGSLVAKDESLSTLTYDLTTVEGIENIDTIRVKAGTTVETFSIDCPVTEPDDGTGDDGTGDDGAGDDNGNAVITLSGCILNATKDISNIEYFAGGSSVAKDESMNTRTYDLTTVAGIEDIDTITVKAGETIETFPIDCSTNG